MNQFFPPHRFVWISGVLGICLATVLAIQSVNYRHPQDPLCGGAEGSGFPLTYQCAFDSPTGPWPTGSWGKTENGGFLFPNLYFWLDVLCYALLLLTLWFGGTHLAYRYFRHPASLPSRNGFVIGFMLLIAAGLMVSTSGFQRHWGGGNLGAGLPLPFILDYSGGGSPLSSAGKIDSGDFPYVSLFGMVVNLLLYFEALWIVWRIIRSILSKISPPLQRPV